MNSWRPYPLLRLIFPFVAGILFGILPEHHFHVSVWFDIALLAVTLIYLFSLLRLIPFRYRWCSGLVFYLILFITGYQLVFVYNYAERHGFIGNNREGIFIAIIDEPPVEKGGHYRITLGLRYLLSGDSWQKSEGRALASCRSDSTGRSLQYGDALLLKGRFEPISDNANPQSFNYASFLKLKGITHQVYLKAYQWRHINYPSGNIAQRFAYRFRDSLLEIFRKQNISGREFGVAAALLLGYTNGIDPELRSEYSATGAMHILSVSGMHVGIIYIFLEMLLGFMSRNRRLRLIKTIVLMLFIWSYALITGLSPSVIRAAAMLSFVIMGRALDRSPDMFNILSASLILILSTNPYLIMDIGFQLSYIAVIGIIVMYKPIHGIFTISSWILEKIWSIVACSLAATIATLPLTLFAFHQFPNYFIITNIAVVPLSSLIIYFGIASLIFSPIQVVSTLIASFFSWLVWLLNSIIHFIDDLPGSTLRGIFLTFEQMLLLYILIIAIVLFISMRQRLFFWAIPVIVIIFLFTSLRNQVSRLHQATVIVYNIPGCSAIDFLFQDKASLIFRMKDPSAELSVFASEIARNVAYSSGIKLREIHRDAEADSANTLSLALRQLYHKGNFIQFRKYRIAILREKIPVKLKQRFKVDCLIISGNPNLSIERILTVYETREIVIDATNSIWRTRKWCTDSDLSGVKCHAVAENGAYVKEL